jgi:hypothetical protein
MPITSFSSFGEAIAKEQKGHGHFIANIDTDDAFLRHAVLETNVHFIQKPLGLDDVARKVRTLLDTK